jgi:hypothetical protein
MSFSLQNLPFTSSPHSNHGTLVSIKKATLFHNPGDHKLNMHCYENFKPYNQNFAVLVLLLRGGKLTTHLQLVPRSRKVWIYTATPLYAFMA